MNSEEIVDFVRESWKLQGDNCVPLLWGTFATSLDIVATLRKDRDELTEALEWAMSRLVDASDLARAEQPGFCALESKARALLTRLDKGGGGK